MKKAFTPSTPGATTTTTAAATTTTASATTTTATAAAETTTSKAKIIKAQQLIEPTDCIIITNTSKSVVMDHVVKHWTANVKSLVTNACQLEYLSFHYEDKGE